MPVFEVHPFQDRRWTSFTDSHPRSSVFHSAEWIEALHRTYKFTPTILTTTPAGEPLTNGIACCLVDSWLTGSRYVSLPFSDHCEPLVSNPDDLPALLKGLQSRMTGKLRYAEIRPRSIDIDFPNGWNVDAQYCFHTIDLRAGLSAVESRLHKDSIRRKIRRAEREHVVIERGRSESQLQDFYKLMVLTRRRHRVPPQPFSWFQNLAVLLGPKLTVHVARFDRRPIASIVTLRHKRALIYKYGASDTRFHNAGAMPMLFWQAIRDAVEEGLEEFDLGRSDSHNQGLIQFKDHLGATKTQLKYWRISNKPSSRSRKEQRSPLMETVMAHLPDRLFRLAGELFYRHAG